MPCRTHTQNCRFAQECKKKATPVIHRPLWLCDFLFVFCTMTVRRRGKWRRAAEDEIPMRNEQTSSESRECKEHHQESLIYTPLLPSPILSPFASSLLFSRHWSELFEFVFTCPCLLLLLNYLFLFHQSSECFVRCMFLFKFALSV